MAVSTYNTTTTSDVIQYLAPLMEEFGFIAIHFWGNIASINNTI